ncbi:MAG: HAD family phosphatase [Actinobacteria bacterium]|nr:HAD family phosphatase [Actinomycetota bacterium]
MLSHRAARRARPALPRTPDPLERGPSGRRRDPAPPGAPGRRRLAPDRAGARRRRRRLARRRGRRRLAARPRGRSRLLPARLPLDPVRRGRPPDPGRPGAVERRLRRTPDPRRRHHNRSGGRRRGRGGDPQHLGRGRQGHRQLPDLAGLSGLSDSARSDGGGAEITTVISDFGGVLTTPLVSSFAAVQDDTGIPMEELGRAMRAIADREGEHPLYELEKGRISEPDFLDKIGDALEPALGHRPEMHRFREIYFEALQPNEPMIELMRELKASGLRMAMLTNNVREWEPLWRGMLPVDEIFELVVDSAFVGMRKPDPEIYELTLERLGGTAAERCLFVDDIEVNCDAARELGLSAVHYRHNDQAISEIRGLVDLGDGSAEPR